MKSEVVDFIDFLMKKTQQKKSGKKKAQPKFGSGKGLFKMHANFDEPLEHFNEYIKPNE